MTHPSAQQTRHRCRNSLQPVAKECTVPRNPGDFPLDRRGFPGYSSRTIFARILRSRAVNFKVVMRHTSSPSGGAEIRRVLPLFAVGLLLVGLVGVFSVTQATSTSKSAGARLDTPTVGEFVVRYARAVGLAGDRSTPEEALGALRASGLVGTSPVSLDARLTEEDVVRLTERMNLGIASESPTKEFSRLQTNTFFSTFGSSLKNPGTNKNNSNANGSGNGNSGSNGSLHGNKEGQENQNCGPNSNNGNGTDPRCRGNGTKIGLSNHFP